jgi:hypothetical protein
MAVLAHLGYKEIAVRSMPGYLAKIRERDRATWPLVARGICSEEHARDIFNLFFMNSGYQIAERLAGEKQA